MMIVEYDLAAEFNKMPPHIDKASWFLGIAAYQNMLTKAQEEPDHKLEAIVALMHFEVETEVGKLITAE